jgi:parallel beta-helix repeat protein
MKRTLASLSLACCPALWSAQFFVAPHGNDAAPGTRNAPFATLGRARDAIRSAKAPGPAEVIVRGGTYYLPATLLLEPPDSGTTAAPVIYRAQEGERVVLSGGLRIAGPWRAEKDGIWSAEVPAPLKNDNIRQLFVNGRREIRARYPNAGDKPAFLFAQGGDKESIRVDLGAVGPHWEAAEGAEVNVVPEWRFFNQWQTISGFDRASGTLRLRGEEPHGRIIAGSWFFIEGARAELDQEREWAHDRTAGRLYYKPENGMDPNRLDIVVPRLNAILQLRGDPEKGTQVEHVHLRNLEFHHTTYTLGHIEARVQTDAAVVLTNASRNRIERCRFVNSGGYGIWLHLDSRDNVIDGNEITEGGAGGVLLTSARFSYQDDSKLFTPGPAAAKAAPLGNRITRNQIHHCGRIRYYCSGVHLDSRPAETALMAGNYVAHNHLHHLSRNGIFAFRNQGGNIFEYNRIEEIMRDTEDGGAIHVATMNQLAAPNVIRNNLIANVWGWRQLPSGDAERHIARGVYLDWFSASTLSENNIVYNTTTGGLQFNAGDDNHFLNNVVIGDGTAWNTRWQKANAQGTRDERNLIIKDPVAKSPFENAAAGDFRLRKDFPGYPEGFNWIDASQIGPSGTAAGTYQLANLAREGGVVNYDQATLKGTWKRETGTGFWGLFLFKYVVALPADDASATFTLPISRDGLYDIRLSFPALPGNADEAHFEVVHVDGTTVERIDMRNFGYWPRLGRYRFRKDRPARIILRAADAGGQVVIEALGFVRVAD